MMYIAATKIRTASIAPATFSTLPCPYLCLSSGGLLDVLTEKKAIIAATRSSPEWIASDMTLTDCIMIPTTSFNAIKVAFETIDNNAARVFLLTTLCAFPMAS